MRCDDINPECSWKELFEFAKELELKLDGIILERNCLLYDKEQLLERLKERTKDYTTHAAKELDKLRDANKDAKQLAQHIKFAYNYFGRLLSRDAIKILEYHEERIKNK